MEQHHPLSPAVRALLVLKAGAVAALVCYGIGLRPLDVALWAVLSGLAVVAALALLPLLLPRPEPARRAPAQAVLPERSAATTHVPDPAVQAREVVVELAREAVLEARLRGASLDELVVLAQALHEATLDLARATLSAGGWVEPALRHELALRDRDRDVDVDLTALERQEQPSGRRAGS